MIFYIYTPQLHLKNYGDYIYPVIDRGVYPYEREVPYIPNYFADLYIGERDVRSVRLQVLEAETLKLQRIVYPSQGFIPVDGSAKTYDSIKPEYSGDYGYFGVKAWNVKGYRLFMLLSVFKYIPSESLLIYARKIKISVDPESGRFPSIREYPIKGRYDLLLIYPDHFMGGAVKRFIDFKKKFAIRVLAVKVSESDNFYGRDRAERIRNMIKYYHFNYGIRWVFLVGDKDMIPIRYAKMYSDFLYGNEIPTDLYYADLDGDWDGNGNGIFGEVGDSLDLIADVYVGRLPVNDENLFYRYIDLLEGYYDFSPRNLRIFALGTDLFSGGGNEGMDAINYMFSNLPSAFYLSKDSLIDLASFLQRLRENFFITVVVHGSFQHFVLGRGYYTIYTADTQNINSPVFLNIIDCNNGALDKPSLVKFIFNNGNSGVIFVRATSRLNSPGFSSYVDKIFIDSVFSGMSVGEAFYKSLNGFVPSAGGDNIYRYLLFGYVLYGDPSAILWSNTPTILNHTINWPDSTYGSISILCERDCRVLMGDNISFVSDGSLYDFTGVFPSRLSVYMFKPNRYPVSYQRVLNGPYITAQLNRRILPVGETIYVKAALRNSGNRPFADTIYISGIYDTTFFANILPGHNISINIPVYSDYPSDTLLIAMYDTFRISFLESYPTVLLSPYGTWIINPYNFNTDTFYINGNPYILPPNGYINLPYDTVIFSYRGITDTFLFSTIDTPRYYVKPLENGIRIVSSDTFMVFRSYDGNALHPLTLRPVSGFYDITNSGGSVALFKVSAHLASSPIWIEPKGYPRKVWSRRIRGVGNTSPIYYNDGIYVSSKEFLYKLSLDGRVIDSTNLSGEVWDNIAVGDGLLGVVSIDGKFSIYDTNFRLIKAYNIPMYPTMSQVAYYDGKFFIASLKNLLMCDTSLCDTIFTDSLEYVKSFSIRPNGEIFVLAGRNLYRVFSDSAYLLKTFPEDVKQVSTTNEDIFVLSNSRIYDIVLDTSLYVGISDGYMGILKNGDFAVSLSKGIYINTFTINDLWSTAYYNQPLCAYIDSTETCFFGSAEGWIYAYDIYGNKIPYSPFDVGVWPGKSYQLFERSGKIYLVLADSWEVKLYELGKGTTSGYWYAPDGNIARTNYLDRGAVNVYESRKLPKPCFKVMKEGVNLLCGGEIYDISGRRVFKGKGLFKRRGVFFIKVGKFVKKVIIHP